MLIIEGPDLAGKTTLAKKLVKQLNDHGWPHIYKHLSRLPDSFHRYWHYREHLHTFSVQDRFHMSEPMYAHARGDAHQRLDEFTYERVDALLKLHGAFTVVLYFQRAEDIKARWREGEMYDFDLVCVVNECYRRLVENDHKMWHGYTMDFDYAVEATQVDDLTVETVLKMYEARLKRTIELFREKERCILIRP